MAEAQVAFNGNRQRHEDCSGHRNVRHGMYKVRKDVSVTVGGHKKSSESIWNATKDDEEDVKASESEQEPMENIT